MFLFDLQRFQKVSGSKISVGSNITNSVVSGTEDADSIKNAGSIITIQASGGNDTINNTGQFVKIYGDEGDDYIKNSKGQNVTIFAGEGNDYVYNYGGTVTISGGNGDDSIVNDYGSNVSISGGAGNDTIKFGKGKQTDLTITGGKGDDIISLGGNHSGNLIQYTQGDGNDVIYSFKSTDTLQITGTDITTMKSGSDVYVFVDDESITMKNVSTANIVTVEGSGSYDDDGEETNAWTISGTTAKYGTSSKTLITVKNVKSLDGISLSGKVVTVAETSLNAKKVTISGDGYTLALSDDVAKPKTTAAGWSVSGTTATYKTKKITAGYTLANNKKSISYTKASGGATKITLSGLRSGTKASYLTLKNNVVTISKNAIGSGKITAKGDGYTFVLGSSGKLTYAGSNATLKGSTGNDSIVGNAGNDKLFGDAGNDKLNGGKGNDTLTGGKGNDTLIGGAGNNVFIYNSGDGNDKITDFSATDTLQIGDGTDTYSSTKSGDNLIVTVGEGIITLIGAANLSNVNIAGRSPSEGVEVKGKKVTLTEDFMEENFALTGNYSKIVTVDASAALLDLNITGNNLSNRIIGSSQNDTIDGGKGSDTLTGGKGNDILIGGTGNDVFVYKKGDGNDKILDYDEGDVLNITGDTVKSIMSGESDVVFNLSNKKKITLTGAADKVITYEVNGNEYTYSVVDEFVDFNKKGTSATLQADYPIGKFTPNLYNDYVNLATINASQVANDMYIVGNAKSNTIIGSSQKDTIDGGAGADYINGSTGNDSLFGGSGNDTLFGGTGSDTLIGGKGNDQLWGNEGKDTFVYANGDGNDTIFDYDSSVDKIILTSGSVDNVTIDRSDNVVFKIGAGQIVLSNAVNKTAQIVDSSGTVLKQYIPD